MNSENTVVNEDVLCEYCKDNICDGSVNTGPHNLCEGRFCQQALTGYLEENSIETKIPIELCFDNLRIGDKIYRVKIAENHKPYVEEFVVDGVGVEADDGLRLSIKSGGYTIINCKKRKSICSKSYFLNRKTAEKVLEGTCVEMIVELSKVIGKLNV